MLINMIVKGGYIGLNMLIDKDSVNKCDCKWLAMIFSVVDSSIELTPLIRQHNPYLMTNAE